jgi:predicted Zn-ribbon and HTH transcriptional regulator
MNLISCENCGVVLDKDRIKEPDMYDDHDEDGTSINKDRAVWYNRDYVPAIQCPVCKVQIVYDNGDTP